MKRLFAMVIMLMIVLLSPSFTLARETQRASFPEIRQDNETSLVLQGVGLKKVLFMRAFAAGFYLGEDVSVEDALADVPKRIEVSYFVRIPGEKLTRYTEKMMRLNMSAKEYAGISDRLKKMSEYFVDLKPGDRYALTYIPELGTQFEYNDNIIGVIEGEDFARGIFSVWIGGVPMDKHLKQQILGIAAINEDDEFQVSMLSDMNLKMYSSEIR